jgi:hypothetical protein
MKPLLLAAAAATALSACAADPATIAPAYVSPATFDAYDCRALRAEAARLSARLAEVTGQQEAAVAADATNAVIAAVIFWPALLWIGSGDVGPELARLRGEAEALQSAATRKGC